MKIHRIGSNVTVLNDHLEAPGIGFLDTPTRSSGPTKPHSKTCSPASNPPRRRNHQPARADSVQNTDPTAGRSDSEVPTRDHHRHHRAGPRSTVRFRGIQRAESSRGPASR